ncbi:uncharacterized protein [Apostichopus japonicus]|uniref:uncharacterized protein isoform X2 n=1 Tax=Stichopus japonicus TaxID=307972 RepID=UPI003AB4F535
MEATIYVFFQVFLILNMAYSVIPASVLEYRKAFNGSVLFNVCHNEIDNTIDWKFQDRVLTFDGLLVRSPLSESLHLLQNRSLYIQPISLLNIGKYECIKNGETLLTYSLDVEVPPNLSMTVDGHSYHDSGDTLYIPYNKTIPVSCYATGGRPAVNISITVDNEEISPSDINTTTNAILNGTTFDRRIMFPLLTAEETGNLSCHSSGLSYYSEQRLEVSYSTYVFPQLYITVNGERTEKKYVSAGENLTVICHADGARPTAVLSFNDRNEVVTEMALTTNTSRRISFVLIKPLKEENITCTSTQQLEGECDLTTFFTTTVTLSDESTTQPTISRLDKPTTEPLSAGYLQLIILSIAIPLLCFLFACTYKITMKTRASSSVNLSTDADTTLGGTTQLQLNILPADQLLLQNPLQGSLQNKQKLDLPSIPSDESNSIHSSGSESNYYSAADERGTKDRIFSENEFCILLTIKVGTIYNRWMGTIRMSRDVNKCAVLTTISEGVMKKKFINWNAFVKRTLDLPTTDRLTRIEGIAVDKTTLYLVTEHAVCETLDSRLSYDPSSHSSPFLVLDVMKHITAIVEGI